MLLFWFPAVGADFASFAGCSVYVLAATALSHEVCFDGS